MLKPLGEVVAPAADFFVEDIALTAIVFDADDDAVTLWVTTVFDEELLFFHLAASFADLSTLLRLAGERGSAVELEIADALAGDTTSEAPADPLTATDSPKAAEEPDDDEDDDDEDDDEDDDGFEPTFLEFITEERPPILLPGIALKLAFTFTDEADTEVAFNIFLLEGIFLHLT